MARVTNEQINIAKNVNLVEFLKQRGYSLDKKGKEFCLKEHDSLCINPNNNCWHWHSRNIGGGNAIDFLRTYENMDFVSAVQNLCGENIQPIQATNSSAYTHSQSVKSNIPIVRPLENRIQIELEKVDMQQLQRLLEWVEAKSNGINSKAAAHNLLYKINTQVEEKINNINDNAVTKDETQNEEIQMPKRNSDNRRAFAYLSKTRCIDAGLISEFMKNGRIYESEKYHNCVFVTYNENKEPMYASMRGTGTFGKPFKGDVENSNKLYGYSFIGSSEKIIVTEAPIDMLSYISMQIMAGNDDWRKDNYLALGCTADCALEEYLKNHSQIKEIYFALDNDKSGKKAVFGDEELGKVGYVEKYKELGYNAYSILPQGKDWNEDLVKIVEMLREQEAASVMDEGLEL